MACYPTYRSSLLAALGTLLVAGCGGDAPQVGQSQHAITDGRIVDGYRGVGLLQAGLSGSVGICTGTMIGERTVLTAAHCIEPGKTHIFHLEGARHEVARVIQHEEWDPNSPQFPNDIGLAILKNSLDVQPAAIALTAPHAGMRITLVGFGATAEGENDAGTKRVATNQIAEVTERRFAYAGSGDGTGSTCNGDSGGPAFGWIDGRMYQVGITSAGVAPCGTLAWDTRVDVFRDWVVAKAAGDVYHHDERPPQVLITSPVSGRTVPRELIVTADVTDDEQLAAVALHVAGREVDRRRHAPYRFAIELAPGPQSISVVAWDAAGNQGKATVFVDAELGVEPGDYGAVCAADADCTSGLCRPTFRGANQCTRACRRDVDCPAGASCGVLESGDPVCLPAVLFSGDPTAPSGDLAGGCSVGARPGSWPPSSVLSLLLLVLWRGTRRR